MEAEQQGRQARVWVCEDGVWSVGLELGCMQSHHKKKHRRPARPSYYASEKSSMLISLNCIDVNVLDRWCSA